MLDNQVISKFVWHIVDHSLEYLCTVDRKVTLKDFHSCFEFYSVDVIKSFPGSTSQFYCSLYEVFNRFFDREGD